MPIINVFSSDKTKLTELQNSVPKIKQFLADKLTCKDIALSPQEISIRFIDVLENGMLGTVEIDITAHSFQERIERQDEICREVKKFIEDQWPTTGNVRVWLKLVELGHDAN